MSRSGRRVVAALLIAGFSSTVTVVLAQPTAGFPPAPGQSPVEMPPPTVAPPASPPPTASPEAPPSAAAPTPAPTTAPPAHVAPPASQAPPTAAGSLGQAESNHVVKPHSGFFVRAGVGVGYFHAWSSSDGHRSFDGHTLSLVAAMGGSPAPGVVLGGALFMDRVYELSVRDDATGHVDTPDGLRLVYQNVAFLVSIYPNPKRGLHFDAALGFSHLNNSEDDHDEPGGFGLALGGGYEWPLGEGPVWLGVLANLSYAEMSVPEVIGLKVKAIVPSLMLALTIN